MKELSLFIDESGDSNSPHTRYFLITAVVHNQSEGITDKIISYEKSLVLADLPNIPFHSEPLLNGHGAYEGISIKVRKKLLYSFNVLVQRLPIRYRTLVYRHSEYGNTQTLANILRRDLTELFSDNLEFFQSFERVKIYYDNGQDIVKRTLYESVESTLSKQAIIKKRTTMTEYRLTQVADYLCTIELAAVKYAARENGGTYDKFFGGIGSFKKNWLKQARRKAIG